MGARIWLASFAPPATPILGCLFQPSGFTSKEGCVATLEQPHWAAIPPLLQDIFQELGRQSFISRFYLAGGTALALQLGHRLSVDLDFFSDTDELEPESQQEIIRALQKRFSI